MMSNIPWIIAPPKNNDDVYRRSRRYDHVQLKETTPTDTNPWE